MPTTTDWPLTSGNAWRKCRCGQQLPPLSTCARCESFDDSFDKITRDVLIKGFHARRVADDGQSYETLDGLTEDQTEAFKARAEQMLGLAIESAKLQHGHRGEKWHDFGWPGDSCKACGVTMEQVEDNVAPRYCAGGRQPASGNFDRAWSDESIDAQTLIAARNAYWDGVKLDARKRREYAGMDDLCGYANHADFDAAHEFARRREETEDSIARAFALNHHDDWADRLSPARRHGLD
jgi:hypothetical protein